jgi:SAM-dependent methyltransferase
LSNSTKRTRPAWQLPPGISRGTWDYLQSPSIADDYDSYFRDHPLLKLDIEVVRRFLPAQTSFPYTIADFGCGTARVARAFMPLGYRMLNVDLSRHMLRQASQADGGQANVPVESLSGCVQGNLVQLNWLCDEVLDMAVCLFSSIGMIRGRENRQKFLSHVCRSLRPNAPLVLHVHNRLRSLLDPGGPTWLLRTRLSSWVNRDWEYGDRVYAYRGLPSMFLHIYSRRELMEDLTVAGFKQVQILPINSTADDLLPVNTRLGNIRAGGYFAIARR